MNKIDAAWLAGLFEGEGCISSAPSRAEPATPLWRLTLVSTDEDVFDSALSLSGVGRKTGPTWGKRSTKPYWTWAVAKQDEVAAALSAMLPRLHGRRRAMAQSALEDIAATLQRRGHCKRGHEWTDASTIMKPDGMRSCRVCDNERQRRYNAERTQRGYKRPDRVRQQ